MNNSAFSESSGLTIREYIACEAMKAVIIKDAILCAKFNSPEMSIETISKEAIKQANSLIKQLKENERSS